MKTAFIIHKRITELVIYGKSRFEGFCQFRDLPGYEKWIVKRTDATCYAIYVRGWSRPVQTVRTVDDVIAFMRDYTVRRWTCTDMFTRIEITEAIEVVRKAQTGELAA